MKTAPWNDLLRPPNSDLRKPKIDRRKRWSSAMELLNVVMPSTIPHSELLRMSRQLRLSDYKFRPPTPVEPNARYEPMSVCDIIEFLSNGVRFIVMEDENLDVCELRIEFLGEDRYPINGETLVFEMRRI